MYYNNIKNTINSISKDYIIQNSPRVYDSQLSIEVATFLKLNNIKFIYDTYSDGYVSFIWKTPEDEIINIGWREEDAVIL